MTSPLEIGLSFFLVNATGLSDISNIATLSNSNIAQCKIFCLYKRGNEIFWNNIRWGKILSTLIFPLTALSYIPACLARQTNQVIARVPLFFRKYKHMFQLINQINFIINCCSSISFTSSLWMLIVETGVWTAETVAIDEKLGSAFSLHMKWQFLLWPKWWTWIVQWRKLPCFHLKKNTAFSNGYINKWSIDNFWWPCCTSSSSHQRRNHSGPCSGIGQQRI